MSRFNSQHNRAVWFDVPVKDLERASEFYAEVLAISVQREQFSGFSFGILEHGDGNGGCLIPNKEETSAKAGLLLYMNVDGRIRDAVRKVTDFKGEILQEIHPIGEHGFRAVVLDSEGNRIALHSNTDS